jgi:putative ABC transport system permease protein
MLRDVRFALRTLRRRRAFAAIAIVTLALGIGAATAIYTVVDGILFRPLPFRQPGRLIAVWNTYPHWKGDPILGRMWDEIPLSIPEFRDWNAGQKSFSAVAITNGTGMALREGGEREIINVGTASATLLDVLGVTPALGRFFTPDEDAIAGAKVTVLSYENWKTRYGGDPHVLGRAIRFDEGSYTVVGVLPRGLSLRHGEPAAPYWIPVGQDSSNAVQRGNHSFPALGRLKPGVSLAAAATEVDHFLRGDEKTTVRGIRLLPWQTDQTRKVKSPLLLLFAAAGLLLLIACVNVATLLLGEAANRRQEIAARVAMGASRLRVLRQLLTEGVVLSVAGVVAGAAVAWVGTRVLVKLAPPRLPGVPDVHMDLRVLLFAMAAALLVGTAIGLAPAFTLAESGPADVLRGASGQSARGRGRLQTALIAVECSLSVVLLVAAGLLSRSLFKLTAVDPGVRTENVLTVRVSLGRAARDTLRWRAFYPSAAERIRALPGVAGVTASTTTPFSGGSSSSSFEVEGEPQPTNPQDRIRHEAQQRNTLAGFFREMGIPVLAGRAYDERDTPTAPRVVVLNQTLARRDWPHESPLGKRIKWQGEWREIIGIVADSRYSKLSAPVEATLYAPVIQRTGGGSLSFLVRGTGDPRPLLPQLKAELRAVEPDAVITGSDLMTTQVKRSFAEERYRAVLIQLFGAIAALLAAVGMYGVTSRAVARRTREIGIRTALGAQARAVTSLVIRQSLVGVAIGAAAGLLGSLLLARYLGQFLFGITATDPLTYALMLGFLGVVTLGASWLPARRAGKVEPAVVLRGE